MAEALTSVAIPSAVPLVSVLMPVFNTAHFVAHAIESVLGQTHSALKLVIQDDGSTDGAQSICAWYAARDSRVRILPPFAHNLGRVAARNALLSACDGDYIAWLDSDDVCTPDRLERQVSFLLHNPAFGAVMTGIHFTDVALRVLRTEAFASGSAEPAAHFRSSFSTLMTTRAAIEDAGEFRETLAPSSTEEEWIVRLSNLHEITHLADPLYCRRLREPPVTPNRRKEGFVDKLARFRPWIRLQQRMQGRKNTGDEDKPIDSSPATMVGQSVAPICQHSLRVAVHERWGDFEESLDFLTTVGDGRWGPVHFAPAATVPNPDYHLVLNRPKADIDLSYRAGRLWFAIGEPPTRAYRAYHLGQATHSVVVTCHEELAQASESSGDRRYVLAPVVTRSWHVRRSYSELAAMADIPKTGCLSWVTSNLTLLPGHRRRLEFLRAIRGRVPFDLYGRGFKKIADKWDGIAPYRYSIAFENYRSTYYFTEKVMDCFVCLTMPLYYGSPELHRFFPANSFITIDPDDPHVIDKLLETINSDMREERLAALEEAKWLVLNRYNTYAHLGSMLLGDDLQSRQAPETTISHRVRQVSPDYGAEKASRRGR